MRQGLAMVVREQTSLKEESKEGAGSGGAPEPKKFLSKRERIAKREDDKKKRIHQEKESLYMGRALGNLITKFNGDFQSDKRRNSASNVIQETLGGSSNPYLLRSCSAESLDEKVAVTLRKIPPPKNVISNSHVRKIDSQLQERIGRDFKSAPKIEALGTQLL